MTMPEPIALAPDETEVYVMMAPAVFDAVQRLVRSRGLYLFDLPGSDDDPTRYVGVGVSQAVLDVVAQASG